MPKLNSLVLMEQVVVIIKMNKIFLSLLIVSLFSLAIVSADTSINPFAEKKIYEPSVTQDMSDFIKADFNSDYGVIRLSNTIFWIEADKIAEYSLTKNTEYCLKNCEAEGKVTLYKDGKLFDDVKFTSLTGLDTTIKSSEYLLFNGYKDEVVYTPVYKEICVTNITGTSCINSPNGYKEEIKQVEVWDKYSGEELKAGDYKWKIKGVKEPEQSLDFIPIKDTKEFSEWAVWNSSLGASLELYYDMNSTLNILGTGHNLIGNSVYNGTACLIGNCSHVVGGFNFANALKIPANPHSNLGHGNLTINLWIKPRNANQLGPILILSGAESATIQSGDNAIESFNAVNKWTGSAINYAGSINNKWVMITYIRNDTGDYMYKNKTLVSWGAGLMTDGEADITLGQALDAWDCGAGGGAGCKMIGEIDEISVWSRGLSKTEVIDLYNDGNGLTYIEDNMIINNSMPEDNINISSSTLDFGCNITGTDLINVTSVILNVNGTANWLQKIEGLNQRDYNATFQNTTAIDGVYSWNCSVIGDTKNASSGYWNFIKDTANPILNIFYPNKTYFPYAYDGQNVSLNYSVIDLTPSSCWYVYNNANTTTPCLKNSSLILTNKKNITLWSNDSLSHIANYFSNWSYDIFENNQTYVANTYESANVTFYVNITYNSAFALSNSYLNYNGTNYLATNQVVGSENILNVNLIVPTIPSQQNNLSFYWNFTLINTTGNFYYSSRILNQTVNKGTSVVSGATCPTDYLPALNFSSYFETNRTAQNFSLVSYYFTYGLEGNLSLNSINYTLTNLPEFYLCINKTQDYYKIGYGEVQYQINNAVQRRYYVFSNTRITNQTTNISLYDLDTALSTSFLITAQTNSLSPYNNYYVGLLRWYPEINSYKVVDMGKTDEQGQTVLKVKTEDVDYRMALYAPNGNLIKLLNPIRLICQTNPCVYSIFVDTNPLDLTTFTNIQNSLTYSSTLNRFTFIWNDPTQTSQTMNLSVYKETGTGEILICSSSANSYTGVLICDVAGTTGNLKAQAVRVASPPQVINQLLQFIGDSFITKGGGATGLFFGSLLLVFLAFVGALISPVVVIFLAVLSLIPLLFLGNITLIIFASIGVIGGVIWHFIK